MENITIGQIAAAVTFLVAFFGGLKVLTSPFQNNENRIKKIELHQDNDNKRLDALEKDTKQILLSVNVLMQHSIDNNHTDELKKRKSELDTYLIQR